MSLGDYICKSFTIVLGTVIGIIGALIVIFSGILVIIGIVGGLRGL